MDRDIINMNNNNKKTEHYTNSSGKDLIDQWIENDTPIEVRAKLIGNIQKYCSRF